jgi:nicotinamidase-related amidase
MAKDTALLVIDVQAGMFGGPDPVHRGKELLETLKALIARARVAGVPVVYVQHSGRKGGFLEEGTPGWQTHPDVEPEPGDLVIHKKTPCSFHETDLREKLDALGIKRLVICGIQSEVCVDTTCRSAFNLGYESVLVEDGHTTFDTPDLPAAAISAHENRVLGSYFARRKKAGEVVFQ